MKTPKVVTKKDPAKGWYVYVTQMDKHLECTLKMFVKSRQQAIESARLCRVMLHEQTLRIEQELSMKLPEKSG